MSQAGLVDVISAIPEIPILFVANIGSATPAANTLNVLGSGIITTTGSGDTITISATSGAAESLTGNSGGAVSPTANNINTVGTGSITIVGNPGTSTLTTQLTGLTNHDVLVGAGTATITSVSPSTAGFVLTSNGVAADPSFQAVGASGAVIDIGVQAATAPGTNPVPPTGAGLLTINGAAVAAQSIPLRSNSIAANTLQLEVQYASSAGGSVATNAGVSSFFNQQFTVDSNGFVTQANGLPASSFGVQAHTAPGTSPVLPTAGGLVTINGTIVAAHSIPIQTDSLAANTLNVEVQRAAATAATDTTSQGMASFNSAEFTVDANGFVALVGGGSAIEKVNVQTGTTPIVPTSGAITINGATVAAGTNPVRTDGTGANTMAVEVQISQALASTDATKIGLCNFSSANFAVDANGFVTASGAVATTYTGDSGASPAVPSSGNLNIFGLAGSQTSTSGSTVTIKSPPFSQVGSSSTSAKNTGEFVTAAVTRTLPVSAGLIDGDLFIYSCTTAGALVIQAVGAQKIRIGSILSGAAGTATSNAIGDSLTLRFDATQGFFMAVSVIGTWTLSP